MVVVVVFVSNFLYIVIGIFLERNFDIVLPRLKEQTEKKNADGWGVEVDVTLPEKKGNTALRFACALGSRNLPQCFVEHGTNVNAKSHRGATPIDRLGEDSAARIWKLLKGHGGHYGL